MLVRVLLRPLVEKELLDLPVEQFLGSLRFEQGIPGSRKQRLAGITKRQDELALKNKVLISLLRLERNQWPD